MSSPQHLLGGRVTNGIHAGPEGYTHAHARAQQAGSLPLNIEQYKRNISNVKMFAKAKQTGQAVVE